jgi:hypothetical protein
MIDQRGRTSASPQGLGVQVSEAERAAITQDFQFLAQALARKDEAQVGALLLNLGRRAMLDLNRLANALEMIANHDGDTPVALARPLDVRIVSQDYEESGHAR